MQAVLTETSRHAIKLRAAIAKELEYVQKDTPGTRETARFEKVETLLQKLVAVNIALPSVSRLEPSRLTNCTQLSSCLHCDNLARHSSCDRKERRRSSMVYP